MSTHAPLHPAEAAARASMAAATRGDRDAWLGAFAPGAVLYDPVGGSPLDPQGEGLRGQAEFERFYDLTVGPNDVRIDVDRAHPAGNEAAVIATVSLTFPTGAQVSYRGVFVYAVDDAGLIESLRAYFDVAAVLAQLSA